MSDRRLWLAFQVLVIIFLLNGATADCTAGGPENVAVSDCTKYLYCNTANGNPLGEFPCPPYEAFDSGTGSCVGSGPAHEACYPPTSTASTTIIPSNQAKPSLIFAGKTLTDDYVETSNNDDSLMIKLRVSGRGPQSAIADNVLVGFVITRNAPPSSISVKLSNGGTPARLTVSGGELVYDTVNGNAARYDHVIVRTHFPFYQRNLVASGTLLMYIPRLSQKDAGDYYFTFMDGVSPTNAPGSPSIISSKAFKLVMQTKTSSNVKNSGSSYLQILAGTLAITML